MKNGTPVEILKMNENDGFLYEPITIKNNRAYVSGARVDLFKPGQTLGDCKIIHVSRNIDLDSGIHVIKTSKCEDGLKYVQNVKKGFFIPVSAVHGNSVYVAESGVAHLRDVEIIGRDMQNVLIKKGINEDDLVILSDVNDGQKIRIIK